MFKHIIEGSVGEPAMIYIYDVDDGTLVNAIHSDGGDCGIEVPENRAYHIIAIPYDPDKNLAGFRNVVPTIIEVDADEISIE